MDYFIVALVEWTLLAFMERRYEVALGIPSKTLNFGVSN